MSMGALRRRIRRADVCPAGSASVAPGVGESLGAHERGPGAGVSRRILRAKAAQPRILETDGGGSLGHPEGRWRFHLEPPLGEADAGAGGGQQRGRRALSRADAGRRRHVQGSRAPAPERQGHGGHRIRIASRALRGVADRSGSAARRHAQAARGNPHLLPAGVERLAAAATADFIA